MLRAVRAGTAPLSRGALAVAAAVAAALLVTAARYGYHRDELYFLACGRHPAWGYPDQPPLVPMLARALDAVAPGSVVVLRTPSALMIAATVLLAALTARELGGSRRAQIVAAASTATMPSILAVGHLLSTTTPDILAAAVLAWLLTRADRTGDERLLLVAGVVLGIALLGKDVVGFVAVALVAGVAIAGPRGLLRSRWLWAGAVVGVLLALPNLWWQARNGWPQLHMAGVVQGDSDTGGRPGLLPAQLLMLGPAATPIAVAGLWRLLREDRPHRALGVAYVVLFLLVLVTGGREYYVVGLYPALLAAGGIAADGWLARASGAGRRRLLGAGLVVGTALTVVIALPVLPVRVFGRSGIGALNGPLRDTVGWPRYVATVADVYGRAPAAAVLLASNYGEAGAIDQLGRAHGLPHAVSGHNGYGWWGPPRGVDARATVVVGEFSDTYVSSLFAHCTRSARLDNGVGVDNEEQGAGVWTCGPPRGGWSAAWRQLRHLG